MSDFNDFLSEPDPLDYARFVESAWLLGPKAFRYEEIGPRYNLNEMCS
jgi:hypothetical protein